MRKEVSKRKRSNKMLTKTLKHFSKSSLILSTFGLLLSLSTLLLLLLLFSFFEDSWLWLWRRLLSNVSMWGALRNEFFFEFIIFSCFNSKSINLIRSASNCFASAIVTRFFELETCSFDFETGLLSECVVVGFELTLFVVFCLVWTVVATSTIRFLLLLL